MSFTNRNRVFHIYLKGKVSIKANDVSLPQVRWSVRKKKSSNVQRSEWTLFHHPNCRLQINVADSINFRGLYRLDPRYPYIFISNRSRNFSPCTRRAEEYKKVQCGWMGAARSIIKNDSQVTLINGDADEESDVGVPKTKSYPTVQGDCIDASIKKR